jgi:hypothetical protein
MDISCNRVCDLSNNLTVNYCTKCTKILSESPIFNGEMCGCPLKIDSFIRFSEFMQYIDCSFIENFVLEPGPTGPTGPIGPVVYNGPIGPTGYFGPIGPIGATGPMGDIGPNGMTGPKGDSGTNGPTGPKGDIGTNGMTGPKGDIGPSGMTGPKGDIGPNGFTGPKGDIGTNGPTGPKGDIGPSGMAGPKGDIGTNGPTGPKGDIGTNGMTGPKGDIGTNGPTGPKGDIGTNGMTGPTGDIGTNGPTGPKGDIGTNGMTGPKGDTGIVGPKGDIGPTGPSGNTFITNGLIYQSFITAYSLTEQELSIDQPIVFDTHSVLFGDCIHNANSPDIWLWKPGNYMVSVGICPIDKCQFSIIKNTSSIIPGGTFGINSPMSSQANIMFIMLLEETDFTELIPNSNNNYGCRIQVVNTSSLTEITTLYSSPNPMPQISATITIIRLTP